LRAKADANPCLFLPLRDFLNNHKKGRKSGQKGGVNIIFEVDSEAQFRCVCL
jgi:hypothetical protein